jgi:hypothetical protein
MIPQRDSPRRITGGFRIAEASLAAGFLLLAACQPVGGPPPYQSTMDAATARDQLLRGLPDMLREAERFDNAIVREHTSLARRRATTPGPDILVVKAQASQRLPEITNWIRTLQEADRFLAREIQTATAYRSPGLGNLLNLRNRLRPRLASLQLHESWFRTLAS